MLLLSNTVFISSNSFCIISIHHMLLLSVIGIGITSKALSISIHHMLLLSLIGGGLLLLLLYFNTSYVVIKRNGLYTCNCQCIISIHHMLLLSTIITIKQRITMLISIHHMLLLSSY